MEKQYFCTVKPKTQKTMIQSEAQLEQQFLQKLQELNYTYRPDIRNLDALEKNFREKFERLNYVSLDDDEFRRLLQENITADVFAASKHLREKQTFPCRPDDAVSVFAPLPDTHVTSRGLAWPLDGVDLSPLWRGTLNRTTASTFTLCTTRPLLLFRPHR